MQEPRLGTRRDRKYGQCDEQNIQLPKIIISDEEDKIEHNNRIEQEDAIDSSQGILMNVI